MNRKRLFEGWAIRRISGVDFFTGCIRVKQCNGKIRSSVPSIPEDESTKMLSSALSHILTQDTAGRTIEEVINCNFGLYNP